LSFALSNHGTKMGAILIAEGVERMEEALTAKDIGFVLGQGNYLGKPSPAAMSLRPDQKHFLWLCARDLRFPSTASGGGT
jgi:EAL domain-containing protein (putative c-di-GMP-specific phosphodiesterase class I)